MNTGNHTLSYIFDNNTVDQFIVPEIQRDYVWGQSDVIDLLNHLKEGEEGAIGDTPYLGFIYAYTIKEYPLKYFLIDGQQRLTTLFLLLILSHQKLGRRIPSHLYESGKMKIDYKVRQTTHDFMTDLLEFYCQNPDVCEFKIEEQLWYHDGYNNDQTISNLVENITTITDWLNQFSSERLETFLDYIEQNVTISYFDIAECRQGEDLYIYMNSRGRHLEPNETLKAKFLSTVDDKEHWGKIWEDWQDFFWKYRGTRQDADAGFNDFLKMVQVITMAKLDHSSASISNFVSSRSDKPPTYNLLPQTILELERYFNAYKWLVENHAISHFFDRYEGESYVANGGQMKLIFLFRLLPILEFVSSSGCHDEKVVVRFVRFFYNVSRKEDIEKGIGAHLPNAIKLIIEYLTNKNGNYDVCDVIDYHSRRSVLINSEEVRKLKIYRNPPLGITREEIEELFWSAEDHSSIFDGEIAFLIDPYYSELTNLFDVIRFSNSLDAFKLLFPGSNKNYYRITVALLYYGFTWLRDTPNYYVNYNCQDWRKIVRNANGTYLLQLLEDMHLMPISYLDEIIKRKMKIFFTGRNFTSKAAIVPINDLFERVRVLAGIDYYSDKKLFNDQGSYSYGYIADDIRIDYEDRKFFDSYADIFNVHRYIDNASVTTRVIPMLSHILFDNARLNEILLKIIA